MQNKNELNTKAKILKIAKQEFLEKGFSDVSVRLIAKKANLTTGAIYNKFKNKDGVFSSIVDDVIKKFMLELNQPDTNYDYNNYNMLTSDLQTIIKCSSNRFMRFLEFFYNNWDEMKLVFCCSKGSSYENTIDEFIHLVEKETIVWLKRDKIQISKSSKFFIHVIVSTSFSQIKEIFDHDLPEDEAREYLVCISEYNCAGWKQYWVSQKNILD